MYRMTFLHCVPCWFEGCVCVCVLLAWFICSVTEGGGQEGPLACNECHVKLSGLQWRPPHRVSSVVPSSAGGGRSSLCTPLGGWRNVCQVSFSVRVSMLVYASIFYNAPYQLTLVNLRTLILGFALLGWFISIYLNIFLWEYNFLFTPIISGTELGHSIWIFSTSRVETCTAKNWELPSTAPIVYSCVPSLFLDTRKGDHTEGNPKFYLVNTVVFSAVGANRPGTTTHYILRV